MRRHLTVVVLTPSRLILAHTDEHAGDDLLPEPYTSTSTEAIALSVGEVRRRHPDGRQPDLGPQPAAEAVITIGWGGVGRLDLEPAGCNDPRVRGRPRLHRGAGLRRLLAARLRRRRRRRRRRRAAVVRRALSARTQHRVTARGAPSSSPPTASRSLGDVVPAVARRPRRRARPARGSVLPDAPAYVVFLVDGLGPGCWSATPTPRRTSPRCWPAAPGTAGVPSTTATSLTSLGTGADARARTGWSASPPGCRAPTGCSTRCCGTSPSTRSSGSRTRPRSPARPSRRARRRGQQA